MTTTTETVIAERIGTDGWLVMWSDGTVQEFESQKAADRAIRHSIKAEDDEIRITRIEWRG